ncbi:hypothetical protein VSR34_01195 [Paraburkholderia sp. JHI2823]|uniref:hypothetical protein n=1 Tax=Paraburkholderia sp. JHI2823 TaxID=3112960 RepID=UPI00317988D0
MNCNCLNEMEDKVAAKFSADLGVPVEAQCQAVAFGMSDSGVTLWHKTEFKITAPTKGYARGKLVPVMASFCPFCGKSAKPEEAASPAQAA